MTTMDSLSVSGWELTPHVSALITQELMALGVPEEAVFAGTQLTRAAVTNAEGMIAYSQAIMLIRNAIRLSGMPELGLYIGSRESIMTWGSVGFLMACCPTIGAAFEVGTKYHKVASSITDLAFFWEDDSAYLWAEPPISLGATLVFAIEELFSALLRSCENLTGRQIRPIAVHCTYQAPAWKQAYSDMFQCPIFFNAVDNRLVFRKSDMHTPTLHPNAVSARSAVALCERQLASQGQIENMTARVRRILLGPDRVCWDQEAVAAQLGMTSRTMRRHLSDENTSFQNISDSILQHRAVAYLQSSSRSQDDIATTLGFSDGSNFRRAFKRWTGSLPSSYRSQTNDRALPGQLLPS